MIVDVHDAPAERGACDDDDDANWLAWVKAIVKAVPTNCVQSACRKTTSEGLE